MAAEWAVPVAVCLGTGIPLLIYILLSLFFFYRPNILHSVNKLQSFKGRSVSHRGGGGKGLRELWPRLLSRYWLTLTGENGTNVKAIAVDCGTDVLEFDVRLTSDDVIVVFHDETMERCCGVSKAVRSVTYEELPLLKSKLNLYYRKDHWTEGEDQRILTLREVFQKFTDMPIMIEIKGTETILVQRVSEMIKEFGREDKTIWGSESNVTSEIMFKQNPNIALFFSYKIGLIMLVYFYTGLLPFIKLKESVLVAPLPAVELDSENGFTLSRCDRIKKWITDVLFMRSSLFWHLSKRGIDTYLFALNKESEFDRAFKQLKVAGVLTDFPSVLSEYLHKTKETPTTTDSLLQPSK